MTKINAATKSKIIRQAVLDAAVHQEEFPGARITGDWDSESYQIACRELELSDEDRNEGWEIYSDALHTAVNAAAKAK